MPHKTGAVALGVAHYADTSAQFMELGAYMEDGFGRGFRYARVGATDLVAGNVIQAAAVTAGTVTLAPNAAAAIGDTFLRLDMGASAGTADDFANGIAVVSVTPGIGYSYDISGHATWASSDTNVRFNLSAATPVQVALTVAASKVDLAANPYRGVIQAPVTTLTGKVSGVAPYIITAKQYGWLQTHGPCGTLINVTPAIANAVSAPSAAAGALAINSGTLDIVGVMMRVGVDAAVKAVFLLID